MNWDLSSDYVLKNLLMLLILTARGVGSESGPKWLTQFRHSAKAASVLLFGALLLDCCELSLFGRG